MLNARTILRADALFEMALAGGILGLAVAGADLRDAFALPPAVVVAFGLLLAIVGAGLWMALPSRPALVAVTAANIAGAFAFGGWAAARPDEMTTAGTAIVLATAAALAVLGVLEIRVALSLERSAR